MRKLLKSQVDPESVAAIVYEPVQGEGGFLPATPGFVEGLIEICREHGIVYIDDEVQTGMGRTGTVLAVDQMDGVEPDLVVWGKSLGGGLPLAGVSGRAELMDAPHVGGLGGTFGGNPLSCAAGPRRARPGRGSRLPRALARDRRARHDRARRHAGAPPADRRGARHGADDRHRARRGPRHQGARGRPGRRASSQLARERGLMLMGAGIYSNVVRILVPLVVTDEDLQAGLDILDGCLADA